VGARLVDRLKGGLCGGFDGGDEDEEGWFYEVMKKTCSVGLWRFGSGMVS
jgi:hypothetical protein